MEVVLGSGSSSGNWELLWELGITLGSGSSSGKWE